jgi:hypothetical protein
MLLSLLLMAFQATAPSGCGDHAAYKVLAAWVGEWDVKNAAGQSAGASRVERSPDGCGLIEHWQGRGVPGTGLHAFNGSAQSWTHLWVDASGFTATLTGAVENGSVVYRRASTQPGGKERQHRMTLAPAEGRITQTGEHSDDGGKTWLRDFQLTYLRRA